MEFLDPEEWPDQPQGFTAASDIRKLLGNWRRLLPPRECRQSNRSASHGLTLGPGVSSCDRRTFPNPTKEM